MSQMYIWKSTQRTMFILEYPVKAIGKTLKRLGWKWEGNTRRYWYTHDTCVAIVTADFFKLAISESDPYHRSKS